MLELAALLVLFPDPVARTAADPPILVPGLQAEATVVRDAHGVVHVRAGTEHDLFFLQGWVHAQDRLFQMDFLRRQASGTLAELVGPAALDSDVLLRTLGLRRAAERSAAISSESGRAMLEAYASGVNAYVASHALSLEHAALELTSIPPWTSVDSLAVAKLIAFGLSFGLDIDATLQLTAYLQAGAVHGFDGGLLYSEDLERAAPFDPTITASANAPLAASRAGAWRDDLAWRSAFLRPRALELAREFLEKARSIEVLAQALDEHATRGSNEWVVGGQHAASGFPLHASDPHLFLGAPSTLYPIHMQGAGFDVVGESFAGVPTVILGQNRRIAWSTTTAGLDVTDVYQEEIVPDPSSPSGLATVHLGVAEHVLAIPEVFLANVLDGLPDNVVVVSPDGPIPAATLVVPRRNQGPIISLDLVSGVALSVQYSGFSGTRELECFREVNRAGSLEQFVAALRHFDVGAQNFAYSDVDGRIAWFTAGEAPVREDLQAGVVQGLPPFFIRDGRGGNEWLSVRNPQPGQALPFEILPFAEMPHEVDPTRGWFANANNDTVGVTLDNDPLNQLRPGGGLYYLDAFYDDGLRATRVETRLEAVLGAGERMSFAEMEDIQADVVQRDAEVFVPWIVRAFENAAVSLEPVLVALASDPELAEAVDRLAAWDSRAPTGIPEGYDASDVDGVLATPTAEEVASSVACTLYNVWRGRAMAAVVDAPLIALGLPTSSRPMRLLRVLLEEFSTRHGVGASGIDFFVLPGVACANDRRDALLLQSLRDALDLLAGPSFETAFHGSTSQDDYRWGLLHRTVLQHVLGPPFSVPPAGGAIPDPLPGLLGIPVDGGWTVDAASFSGRGDHVDAFMFPSGPVRRTIHEARSDGVRGVFALPGGTSGALGSPFHANLLPSWLTNDCVPILREVPPRDVVQLHAFRPVP